MAGIIEQLKGISDEKAILALEECEFKAVLGLSPPACVKLRALFPQSERGLQAQAAAQRGRLRQRQVDGARQAPLRTLASR
jgi:hypothetical protein